MICNSLKRYFICTELCTIRFNGPWINYRLPKTCHTGKTFIQLEPEEFIDRVSRFIPYPRRHRRHYHGVFAPSSPLRKQVAANVQKQLDIVPKTMLETVDNVRKASRGWAALISRIYEVDPLTCSSCGQKIKIMTFVTHPEEIRRILRGIGWPITIPNLIRPQKSTVTTSVNCFQTHLTDLQNLRSMYIRNGVEMGSFEEQDRMGAE